MTFSVVKNVCPVLWKQYRICSLCTSGKYISGRETGELSGSKTKINTLETKEGNDTVIDRTISGIKVPHYMDFHAGFGINLGQDSCRKFVRDMVVHEDFLTEAEEQSILDEVLPSMKRLRYEYDHWDDAIHGYRETERLNWNNQNKAILDRVKDLALLTKASQLPLVHVLDLAKNGYIKPHVDSVRFSGNIIAGMCLLSNSVMRLVHEEEKENIVDVLLRRRSLYIMRDFARYSFTHEILSEAASRFMEKPVQRDRRISVICRNQPHARD